MAKPARGTDLEWERLARMDAMWSVRSNDEFRAGSRSAADEDAFWSSGEDHVERTLAAVEALFGPVDRAGAALDFGCGVARVLAPLARRFDRAVGIDVSPTMLEHARGHLNERGLDRVELRSTPEGVEGMAFVHSCMVLQHIPRSTGEDLFRQLVATLAPNGVAAIHVPIDRSGDRLRGFVRDAQARVPAIRPVLNVVRGRRWDSPLMQMNIYPPERLASIVLDAGITGMALTNIYRDPEFVFATVAFQRPARPAGS